MIASGQAGHPEKRIDYPSKQPQEIHKSTDGQSALQPGAAAKLWGLWGSCRFARQCIVNLCGARTKAVRGSQPRIDQQPML